MRFQKLHNRPTKQDIIFSKCSNCSDFSHFILSNMIKNASKYGVCRILRLKCPKFYFGWDSAPDHTRGVHSAPPDTIAGFKGVLLLRDVRKG